GGGEGGGEGSGGGPAGGGGGAWGNVMRLVLAVLAAALGPPAAADLTADVRAHEEAFARACTHGDVSGVVRLYTDDATVIWPGEPEETRNRAALQRLVADACPPDRGLEIALHRLHPLPLHAPH